ncbi:MAG: hypothetical protein LAO30_20470 [Acidobacteriia bacterium]|nr:hypothetical protein [Terriglobia bacterium]
MSIAEKHLKVAAILALVGGIGVALTIWGAVRSGTAQAALQAQIDRIEKHTEIPPTVTVNPPVVNVNQPPAVLRAELGFEKLVSSYDGTAIINGNQVAIHPMLLIGRPVSQNLYFTNTGTAIADKMTGVGIVYIASTETEQELTAKFKQALHKLKYGNFGTLETAGRSEFWFTATSEGVITQDDMEKIRKGAERIYLFASVEYRDPSGAHYAHYCRSLQTPAMNGEDAIWHFCNDFSDHR